MFVSKMNGSLYLHKLVLSAEPHLCVVASLPCCAPEDQAWECVDVERAIWAPDDSAVLLQYHMSNEDDNDSENDDWVPSWLEQPPQCAQVGPIWRTGGRDRAVSRMAACLGRAKAAHLHCVAGPLLLQSSDTATCALRRKP